ncbi:plasmid partitioning protein RepA [Methylocystis echinoides]|uniref:Plasmid partitioning protein RepA n=1 Tax=Methylocystis echinoides TaxID=29468 RepID=A0A9W6LU64_9HYPH|nr:plasmid partitioning protein RepA [Methylocystis echinoides]GLI95333.1 plasmid partitioning protein RepA [Methylocystis echinoides]
MDARADTTTKIDHFTEVLSRELLSLRTRLYPPSSQKTFGRTFTTNDLVRLLKVPESTLRSMTLEGKGPQPARLENNRRVYTLEQVSELRSYLAEVRPEEALTLKPWRRGKEELQIVTCTNFKGGSSKTTSSVHLAHYLAIQGYRVLCIDLDPQASLTSLFGLQPEFDVGPDETAYAAIRYNDHKPFKAVIRKTYIPGVAIVPGNLELMEFEHDTARALASRERDALGLFFMRLKKSIDQVAQDFDVAILDTPPNLGFGTLAGLFAATILIITVHPAMLDVASMNQYLIMLRDLAGELARNGARLEQDWIRFLITRHTPNDGPQAHIVGLLRHLFDEHVFVSTAVESTSVAAAGLAKKSLYELEAGEVPRESLKRALESMDSVNAEILALIHKSWGRS